MGVVAKDAKALFSRKRHEREGFPVATTSFLAEQKKLVEMVDNKFNNFTLIGKAAGRVFFQQHVLVDTYNVIKEKEL